MLEGPSARHDAGDARDVDLSAPTQLVPMQAAAAGEHGPEFLATMASASDGSVVLETETAGQQVVSGDVCLQEEGGTDGLTGETAVDDEIREEDLTQTDTSTWTGRALDRWQREGHLY